MFQALDKFANLRIWTEGSKVALFNGRVETVSHCEMKEDLSREEGVSPACVFMNGTWCFCDEVVFLMIDD